MTEDDFKQRTKKIAIRVMRLVDALPKFGVPTEIGKQLLRSGTSIGANYRAACRGKSKADVLHKLAIVEEEADESLYWIELLIESETVPKEELASLINEIDEIVRMTVASIITMKQNATGNPKSKIQNLK